MQGWLVAQQGQRANGIALMQQGLQEWRATGVELIRPYYLALLAAEYGRQGQPEAGLSNLDEALQLVARTGERWWEAELWRLKGELILQPGVRRHKKKGKRQKSLKFQWSRSRGLKGNGPLPFTRWPQYGPEWIGHYQSERGSTMHCTTIGIDLAK